MFVDNLCSDVRVDKGTFTVQEQDHFTRMCQAFAVDLVPYFNACLQTLFPPSQLALMLGVPVSELNKMVIVHINRKSSVVVNRYSFLYNKYMYQPVAIVGF